MSIRVDGKQAQVHILSQDYQQGKLGPNCMILYLVNGKLGQVTRSSLAGLTPAQAFESRYTDKSSMLMDHIAQHIWVADKIHGPLHAYDDGVRELCHRLYQQKRLGFDALYPGYQQANSNSESLVGFDSAQHLTELTAVILQYFGLEQRYTTKQQVSWRHLQLQDAVDLNRRIDKYGVALYSAFTGRGKTKIAMEVAAQRLPQGGIVLVTTPVTDTKRSFVENCTNWHFGTNRNLSIVCLDAAEFNKTTIGTLLQRKLQGELLIILLTVQDLRWGEEALDPQMRTKYLALQGCIDLWIRDERHTQYEGWVTRERLSNMRANSYLDLTATPYAVLEHYKPEQILSRSLAWAQQHRKILGIPQVSIETHNLDFAHVSPKIAALYTVAEGFDPRKLFVRANGNFLLRSELLEIRDRLYHSPMSKRKNTMSIVNDPGLSAVSQRCGMWVLPEGDSQDPAVQYIPALAAELNTTQSKTHFLDSYTLERECPRTMTLGEYVDCLLQQHERVVILTCGKFITGTDIPALGHIVLFNRINSCAVFEQLLGRTIRGYPGKEQVKMYCYAPGMDVRAILGEQAHINAELHGDSDIRERLECIALTEYDEQGEPHLISADSILEAVQNYYMSRVRHKIPTGTIIANLEQYDQDAWSKVLKTSGGMKITRGGGKKITEITPDNGGEVFVPSRDDSESHSQSRTQRDIREMIATVIQNIMAESIWVAYTQNCWDIEPLLNLPVLSLMFPHEMPLAREIILEKNPDMCAELRRDLKKKQLAYSHLSMQDVHDQLFINTEYKRKLGLVYVPMQTAHDLVAKLDPQQYNKTGVSILVVNALSGSISTVLRERLPLARIVCAEWHPYFREHLGRQGFQTLQFCEDSTGNLKLQDTDMQFDVVIGNPPYQKQDAGDSTGASPIYHLFVDLAKTLANNVVLIIPSRWFAGGKGLDTWRTTMLCDDQTRVIVDYPDSTDCFPDVSIMGGVCYVIWQRDTHGDCVVTTRHRGEVFTSTRPLNEFDKFIRFGASVPIVRKVLSHQDFQHGSNLSDYSDSSQVSRVSSSRPFGLRTNYTNMQTQAAPGLVKIWGNNRVGWVERSQITVNTESIDRYKVLITAAYGGIEQVLNRPIIAEPGSCCTETYIVCGVFDTLQEAENQAGYIRTKFFRFMVAQRKLTQHNPRDRFLWVPLLDMNTPWSDTELYDRYALTAEERAHIEKSIKPMPN